MQWRWSRTELPALRLPYPADSLNLFRSCKRFIFTSQVSGLGRVSLHQLLPRRNASWAARAGPADATQTCGRHHRVKNPASLSARASRRPSFRTFGRTIDRRKVRWPVKQQPTSILLGRGKRGLSGCPIFGSCHFRQYVYRGSMVKVQDLSSWDTGWTQVEHRQNAPAFDYHLGLEPIVCVLYSRNDTLRAHVQDTVR